jgi:hypothetical protein
LLPSFSLSFLLSVPSYAPSSLYLGVNWFFASVSYMTVDS